jgi:hypothetical protein
MDPTSSSREWVLLAGGRRPELPRALPLVGRAGGANRHATITLRGSEITHYRTLSRWVRRLRIVHSPAARSASTGAKTPLTRGGQMMTTSREHEPRPTAKDGLEAWPETVAAARHERRQRGERYPARHRRAPHDTADGPAQPKLSA